MVRAPTPKTESLESFVNAKGKRMLVLVPLGEVLSWLYQRVGPTAPEVLHAIVDLAFDETPDSSSLPPAAYKKLMCTLENQCFNHQEADAIQREGFGRLISAIEEHVPGWDEYHGYLGMNYSMHSFNTLKLCLDVSEVK